MTFLVNQDGVVRQRDLGKDTMQVVGEIKQLNWDDGWILLAPER